MSFYKMWFITLILTAAFMTGCGSDSSTDAVDGGGGGTGNTSTSTVSLTSPTDLSTGSLISGNITATFSEAMNPTTFTNTTFTLKVTSTSAPVTGFVTYAGFVATFNPTGDLAPSTEYTATITTGVMDPAGNNLAADKVWTFTTGLALEVNPTFIDIQTAGNYAIFASAAITTTLGTYINGDIGIYAVASAYNDTFALVADDSNVFSKSFLVSGKVYAKDYVDPSPTNTLNANGDVLAAYNEGVGRDVSSGATTSLGTPAGTIGGLTLYRGVYTWGGSVTINTDITVKGGPDDIFIFITPNTFNFTGGNVILSGGAQAKNIFWVAAEGLTTSSNQHIEGIVLTMTTIALTDGATVNGRLLSQFQVTLIGNAITTP